MEAYSQDLRECIVGALEAGDEAQVAIAETFGVSLSFVEKLWRRWRADGSCAALPQGGGRPRSLADDATRIRKEVQRQPEATLAELCERVAHAGGAQASPSRMCRELQRLDLPRKKSRSMPASGTRRG